MKYCGKCGAPVEDGEQFCTSCGARVKADGQVNAVQPASAQSVVPAPAMEVVYESKFTGGAFANFFIGLITAIVSVITLFLAYPVMVCWHKRWEANHTYINGRRLRFDGKAMQLFGKFIIWLLLSLITFGLYYIFCMRVALEKWYTKHTHFAGSPEEKEDEEDSRSVFDGNSLGLFGVNLLTFFVTVITLTFGSYWAHCYKERWFCKHKTIDGARLYFDGKAAQYFGKRFVWYLLTIITLGIYSFWLIVKSKKWTIYHTKTETGAKLPPADINGVPIATVAAAQGNVNSANGGQQTSIGTAGFVLSMVSLFTLPFLCIPGIICSIISLAKKENKKGFAIAGLIIGISAILVMAVAISIILKNVL